VEALARFTGPPTQTPDLWFAEAAELGSLLDLELATGSAALGRLRDLPADTYLSVNFSPSTVCSSRLLEELEGVRTDHVVVEITEHAAVEDYKELCESLEVLRARGLRVAIDDAGAGFSSLQHILWLMPELIKLDISLTRGIHLDRHRQSLARALISFAADLGADVVAEGVETAEEMDALVKLGVSLGQGYFLGRPGSLPDSGPTPPSPWASRAA
jgi:EAL domain-containing protein (putative c-di-GMP-specific phosphodiesterase class I)